MLIETFASQKGLFLSLYSLRTSEQCRNPSMVWGGGGGVVRVSIQTVKDYYSIYDDNVSLELFGPSAHDDTQIRVCK